jgi:transposase
MAKIYIVNLSEEERTALRALLQKGTAAARKIRRAQVLLLADDGQTDAAIARVLQVGVATVERLRQRCVEEGLAAALSERPRPGGSPKLDGKGEAHLLALACTPPPAGHKCWTMQLLADKLVELGVVATISDETVRRRLKGGTSSAGSASSGVSPA